MGIFLLFQFYLVLADITSSPKTTVQPDFPKTYQGQVFQGFLAGKELK